MLNTPQETSMNRLFFLFLYSFQALYAYQYTLTVSAIFKDEAPYLKEWIEYHKMMGVEHFRLYNNDSEDEYLTVLAPYIEKGEVSLVEWPSSKKQLHRWAFLTQLPACHDAIKYYEHKSKWLALIDIDEFLLPLEAPDIVTFLQDFESYPGVVLNWQCFGTSFVNEIPQGNLLIETLTLKAEEFSSRNIAVKSIVRPEYVDIEKMAWVPHTFHYLTNTPAVFPNKEERPENLDTSTWKVCVEKAVINHYVHRTESYFWNVKIPKKLRMENGGVITPKYVASWYDDCNQIEDKKILRFVPELKKRMASINPTCYLFWPQAERDIRDTS